MGGWSSCPWERAARCGGPPAGVDGAWCRASAAPADVGFIEASKTGGIEPLILEPRGNKVGIGTTTPAATLDVNGGVRTLVSTVSALPACGSANEGDRRKGLGAQLPFQQRRVLTAEAVQKKDGRESGGDPK